MRKTLCALLMLLTLIGFASMATGETAADITSKAIFTANGKKIKPKEMRDRKYTTYYTVKKGGRIEADGGQNLSAVKLQFYERAARCLVEACVEGEWQEVGEAGDYLSDYFSLPEGTRQVRLTNLSDSRMYLAEVTLYGEGEEPEDAPHWTQLSKADLMLVVAHPDDELLWFGGLLPTYAGERQLAVQVVYVVPTTPNRRLELLDGLAHCGVTAYPAFVGMRDVRANTLEGQYKKWNRNRLYEKMTELVRRYQPEVLVTQDFHGEYGHGAHRATADAAVKAVEYAAKEKKYASSAKAYGTWQVKKVYVHLYDKGQLSLDWHIPLDAFGGKDSMTVATEALACHASQMKHGWGMEEGGSNDNRLLGLYFTTVGEDSHGDDLMENIPADALLGAGADDADDGRNGTGR